MSVYGIGRPVTYYGWQANSYPQASHAPTAADGVSAANAAAGGAAAGAGNAGGSAGRPYTAAEMQALKRMGQVECQTCKNRTYQDGSNDPGVSFKAPGHIDPESSGAVVRAHEQEHVANEQAKAKAEGRRVISQSVRLFTSVCPECGRAYVSGGVTRTVTASDGSRNQAIRQYDKSNNPSPGSRVNSGI
jgi:hypothetical protein